MEEDGINRVVAVREGNMKDLQKLNEYLREEGFVIGDILPFGDESHIFILFKPKQQESGDEWGGDGNIDEEDDQ